jgi:hypothetical protein
VVAVGPPGRLAPLAAVRPSLSAWQLLRAPGEHSVFLGRAQWRHRLRVGSFWSAKASDYLRGYFHAAALAGYDLRAVAAWVSGADPDVPEQVLTYYGARQWALTLAELRSSASENAGLLVLRHEVAMLRRASPRPGWTRPAAPSRPMPAPGP